MEACAAVRSVTGRLEARREHQRDHLQPDLVRVHRLEPAILRLLVLQGHPGQQQARAVDRVGHRFDGRAGHLLDVDPDRVAPGPERPPDPDRDLLLGP